MRKLSFSVFLILLMGGIFCTTCFAAENETISFTYDTVTSLTKSIVIKATSNVVIDWEGNGLTDEITNDSGEITATHTYSSGKYTVSITANDITEIKASNIDLISIDVSQAILLETLDVSKNKLESIDLSKNENLSNLICSDNYLSELVVNSDIESLDCSNNKIASLFVPKSIEKLYINRNKLEKINGLTSFDLSDFSNLIILKCNDNDIKSLTFSNCQALEEIYCSNNLISEIDLTNNGSLKKLYCSGNEIQILSLTGNPLLKELDCSGNKIQTLSLSNNIELEILNCVGNKISSLSISNNSKLKELLAIKNDITSLNLNNINLSFVVLDNEVNVTNSKATTLVKIEVRGDGSVSLTQDKIIYFIGTLEKVLVNNVEQVAIENMMDISNYTGEYSIIVEIQISDISDSVTVNEPQLVDGMIPLKHNGQNWVISSKEDPEWYDYSSSSKKWANVMLRDGAKYLDLDGETPKDVGDTPLKDLIGREVLSKDTGSMYVWIPRYTYTIFDDSINVKYSNNFYDYTLDEYIGYKVHPAFNYSNYKGGDPNSSDSYSSLGNSDKQLGIWVAKYSAGNSINAPKYAQNASTINGASIGDAFSAAKITTSSTMYGLNGGSSHMMKNAEWGAVAYLTTSAGDLTGNSTTGNVYGIYDMDINAEYVSNFVELIGGISNVSVRKNGKNLIPYTMISYGYNDVSDIRDIEILRLTTNIDSDLANLNALSNFFGFGINEIKSNISGVVTQSMPTGVNAFFVRGIDGIYSYSGSDGAGTNNIGFRNVILASEPDFDNVNSYVIKAHTDGNGEINPEGNTTVEAGNDMVYSIIPKTGFEIIDVTVDGVSVYYDLVNNNDGEYYTYTFYNVDSNHEISVKFDYEIAEYEVFVTKEAEEGGNVEGAGKYYSRSTVTLNASENVGYKFSTWEVVEGINGIADLTLKEISFKMPNNNVTLKAYFEKILEAILTVDGIDTRAYGYEDVDTTVFVEVSDKYGFSGWYSNEIDIPDDQLHNLSIEFVMPPNNVTITPIY